ncbi:hypothetical protein Bca4012_075144 [Brassica carinata]
MASTSLKKYILDRVLFTLFGTMLFMAYSNFRLRQYYSIADHSAFALTTSSFHLNCTYDVFPSFHGADVRRGFLSHLLKEFKGEAIDTFVDNNIERGKSIGPRFIKSIRGSKIAIVLLSRNYASSTWCLNELAEIMSCRKDLGLIVMVIFYEVDPSDVKKLTGHFGRVFRKTCAGKIKGDIVRWRQALAKVATIAGYHSTNWDNEAAMIEQIANDISHKLNKFAGPSSETP